MNFPSHFFFSVKDRPDIFESKLAESEWENRRQAEVEELRRKIESGEFIPEEIRMKSGVGNLASKVKIRQEKVNFNFCLLICHFFDPIFWWENLEYGNIKNGNLKSNLISKIRAMGISWNSDGNLENRNLEGSDEKLFFLLGTQNRVT